MREAFKRRDLDMLREFTASGWRDGYEGLALREGLIVKTAIRRGGPGTMETLVMNLRRPPSNDIRVRQTLNPAFDAEFYRDLQGDPFDPPGSSYGTTRLAGQAEVGPLEQHFLSPFLDELPEGILQTPRSHRVRPVYAATIETNGCASH